MRIRLLAVGRSKAREEAALTARYVERLQRLGPSIGFSAVAMTEIDESRARNTDDRRRDEAERLLSLGAGAAIIVALDETGRSLSTAQFTDSIARWRDDGMAEAAFLLGGPDGHGPAVGARADLVLSLSAMTLPHLLARVVLAEQLYRAATLLAGHPYHRA